MNFTVAIVGRPNVGKSTLFNRLVGKRLALVAERPGVTRDRREGDAHLFDLDFTVIDTAGLEEAEAKTLEARMREQTERAVEAADLALLLIDARAGVTPLDRHFAAWLRRGATPILVVANKSESRAAEAGRAEAFALGLGEPIAISAEHDLGLPDLRDAIADAVAERGADRRAMSGQDQDVMEAEGGSAVLQLAIVGRPNVGKSTLVNQLIGEERVLTGPEAGITRDAIALEWSYKDRPIRLIDTAGLRRRAKTVDKVEKMSVADAQRAVNFAQVVVLLLDAETPMEKQDLAIARQVIDEGRALVLAINKWDRCKDRAAATKAVADRLERSLPQVRGVPVVTISALKGQNINRLLDAVFAAYDVWNQRVGTADLNRWLSFMVQRHPPPAPGGRRITLRYMTQAKTRPPGFVIFCSRPKDLPDAYLRYLENALREDFDLPGTPIRIVLRKGDNPYAPKR